MGNISEVTESLARMPPGSAKIGCLTQRGAVRGEILWLLREDSRKIDAMKTANQRTGFCCGLILGDNVAIISFLVSFGPPAAGNIWETWLNLCEPETKNWLQLLSTQPELSVHLIGDKGTSEGASRQLNPLTHFAGAAAARTKGLQPWSVAQFERLCEQVYRRWPDMVSLWKGAEHVARTSFVLVPPHAKPSAKPVPAADAGQGLLSAGEMTLRGLQEPIRSVPSLPGPF